MLETDAKRKNGIIELFRFLGIVFIMCGHFRQIGLTGLPRPFADTWLYVEFFLILSGFLTAKHFQMKDNRANGITTHVENGIIYTIKKYRKFLPYVVLAVFAEYLIKYRAYLFEGDYYNFFKKAQEMPFEIFLLSAAGTNGTLTFPIWYLSATFLVSPFICIISQLKNKYIIGMLSFYPALFYYLYRTTSIGNHDYPNQIVRAMCGMLLGVFVYLIADHIGKRTISKKNRFILTVFLLALIGTLLYISYSGISFISTYLFCFIGIFILTFSRKTYLPFCDNAILRFLGKLSMPMFILHWPVAHFLVLIIPQDQVATRIIAYYLGTIFVSLLMMGIISVFSTKKGMLKKVSEGDHRQINGKES